MIPQKKVVDAVAMTTTQTINIDLDVKDGDELHLVCELLAAGAAADLTVEVRPYDANGALFDQPMLVRAADSVVAALVGGAARLQCVYDVAGLATVQIRVKNNNAATKTVNCSAYVSEEA